MTWTITLREDWSAGFLRSSKENVPPGCKTKAWLGSYKVIEVSRAIIKLCSWPVIQIWTNLNIFYDSHICACYFD